MRALAIALHVSAAAFAASSNHVDNSRQLKDSNSLEWGQVVNNNEVCGLTIKV